MRARAAVRPALVVLGIAAALLPVACRSRSTPSPPPSSPWTWLSPRPQGNALAAVWARDERTVYAVGEAGTVVRSDDGGVTWRVLATGVDADLTDVLGGGGGVIAVGTGGTVLVATDGRTFVPQARVTEATLEALWTAPDFHMYAVGGRGTLLRSTNGGAAWTPIPTRLEADLLDVVGDGHGALVAVGESGTIATSPDAMRWTRRTSGVDADLHRVRRLPNGAYVAVGAGGIVLRSDDEGATWTRVPVPTEEPLLGLGGRGRELVACGTWGTILRSRDGGSTWARLVGGTEATLLAATLSGPAVIAVGNFGEIVRSADGEAPASRRSAGETTPLTGGWSSPDGAHVYVAGGDGTLLHGAAGAEPASVPGTEGALLAAVAGDARHVVVVGAGGRILRARVGTTAFAPATSGTDRTLTAIASEGDGVFVAVGDGGTILRSADGGATWGAVPSGTTQDLSGAAIGPNGELWVVGRGGTVLHAPAGAAPAARGARVVADLSGVVVTPDARVVVVGRGGTLAETRDAGATWGRVAAPTRHDLNAVGRDGDGSLVAVGDRGTMVRLRGDQAVVEPSGTRVALRAVWSDARGLYVAGAGGALRLLPVRHTASAAR